MNLTDEKIRIKVAEAMGWTGIRGETGYPTPRARELGDYQALPNYPADLNSCAEFEATLTDEEWETYSHELFAVAHPWDDCGSFETIVRYTASATARQRCIAFLKTKGLIP